MESFTIREMSTMGLERKFNPPPVKIIGCYSSNPQQSYIDGPKNLRYAKLSKGNKSVEYNLDDGLDPKEDQKKELDFQEKRKELQRLKLVHFMEWVNLHNEEVQKNRPNFVLLRGLMEKIVTTPYRCRYNEDWCAGAMRKNGTIYIQRILSKEKPGAEGFRLVASDWGRKFKNFVFSDEPDTEPDPKRAGTLGDECFAVLRTNIGGQEILYSAELDGVCAKEGADFLEVNKDEHLEEFLANCRMVKIKSCSKSQHSRPLNFRKFKSRAWWVQASLGGISNMIIGYRDDKTGKVEEIENMTLTDLYGYGLQWYGESGYKFLEEFLAEVKARVREEGRVYVFSFDKQEQSRRDFKINFRVAEDGSEYMIPNAV